MNLKKLKYFKVLAEELNFKIASEKLFIDQSSISRAIQGLESRLGINLFERHFRQLKLTEEGYLLLRDTNQIFYLINSMKNRINSSKNKKNEIIELAISPNIDGYKVAELLRIYREQYPSVQLNIHENSYQNILSGLKHGQYHLGLSFHKPTQEHKSLIFRQLWQEKLIVLLSKRHPLSAQSFISLDDINKYPFISLQPDTLLYEVIYTRTFTPPATHFVKSYSVLQSLVIAGYGISLVTESMYTHMQNKNIIIRNTAQPLLIDNYLIYQKENKSYYNQMMSIQKLLNPPLNN